MWAARSVLHRHAKFLSTDWERMADMLQCQDRWRRLIVVTESTWHGKILRDHPELAGNVESVRRTLTDPDSVAFDRDDSSREVYYRLGALPSPDDQSLLKVCVAFSHAEDGDVVGRVVTAYAVDRRKPGERPKWQK